MNASCYSIWPQKGLGVYIPFPLFPGGAVSAAGQSFGSQCSPRTGGSLLHAIQEVGVVNHDVQPQHLIAAVWRLEVVWHATARERWKRHPNLPI